MAPYQSIRVSLILGYRLTDIIRMIHAQVSRVEAIRIWMMNLNRSS
ncbi:hypothetical protein [Bifidobacterium crudilactis]|nr:hypothetical protein [Bifidobacterium crudilactis]